MADPRVLNLHPPEFEPFLYASVGDDRNGYGVTVLSALARLGLDPWAETADLVTLGREAARARLDALLARFRDVPALERDHGRVARDLSRLLPESRTSGGLKRAAATVGDTRPRSSGAIWAVLAMLLLLFWMFMTDGPGPGE
jgi:hypothetical protein